MSDNLKPCPFCGSAAYDDKSTWRVFGRRTGHEYAVACGYCEASSPGDDNCQLAIAAWNNRAAIETQPAPDVAAMVEAARKVVSSYWNNTDGVITGMYDLERALAAWEEKK